MKTTQKFLTLTALVLGVILMAGCPTEEDKTDSGPKTSIRIRNESSVTLMGVSLGDLDYFATAAQNPMNEGLGDDSFIFSRGDISSKIYVTEPVSGYIHFLIRIEERGGGMTHRCRTKELVVVDIGENVEFIFTDGSQVVDSEDATRVLSLTDMDAYLRTQLTW